MPGTAVTSAGDVGTRQRRVRSGCMRCRVRRRKCDEAKPRCGRCSNANAECQYGPRLSFLKKNALTLAKDHVTSEPVVASSASGDQLPDLNATTNTKTTTDTRHTRGLNTRAASHPADHSPWSQEQLDWSGTNNMSVDIASEKSESTRASHLGQTETPNSDQRRERLPNVEISQHSHRGFSDHPFPVPEARFNMAMDALLSLGTGQIATRPSAAMPTASSPSREALAQTPRTDPSAAQASPYASGANTAVTQIIEAQKLNYFRRYRYNIAPWIDMCDMRQTFGLDVSLLAVASRIIPESLIALAASNSPDQPSPCQEPSLREDMAFYTRQPWHEMSLEYLISLALCKACRFLSDARQSWKPIFSVVDAEPSDVLHPTYFAHERYRWLWSATLALLTKLELACCLVNEEDPDVASWLARQTRSLTESASEAHHGYNSTCLCLSLCADAMNLCSERGPRGFSKAPAPSRATAWKSLFTELEDWQETRTLELRPTIEMEADDEPFPVIFFTSGTGIHSNIMYHAAMLILLDDKPRTIQLGSGKIAHMSALWHARRICGIALNNDRRACWDPCLIGAFFLASRRMTSEVQQRAIISAMDRIEGLGWSIASLVIRLRQDWGLEP